MHNKPQNKDIYDERCSPESWSSLLTSPRAENNRGLGAFQVPRQSVKKVVSEGETISECLVVSSHVLTLKHEVEQQLLTLKQLLQLLQETNKQPFPTY